MISDVVITVQERYIFLNEVYRFDFPFNISSIYLETFTIFFGTKSPLNFITQRHGGSYRSTRRWAYLKTLWKNNRYKSSTQFEELDIYSTITQNQIFYEENIWQKKINQQSTTILYVNYLQKQKQKQNLKE